MICRLNPVSAFEAEKLQDGASILTDGGIETRIVFETTSRFLRMSRWPGW